MAKVIQMFSKMDEDMKDYNEKLRKHRTARLTGCGIAVLVILLGVWGISYYLNNRSFTSYSISSSAERSDTLNTKYESFGGNILKYSRDGISYTNEKNSLLFNITYTMQSPMLALSEYAGAVADKNGNQIFIFDRQEQKCEIKTLLPIKNVVISNQGVTAVLMEETGASKLEVYSSEGTLLGEGVFSLEDAGYPMDLSISEDGNKIAVAFAQVTGSSANGCVAVYNFDSVGENYVDHLVFAKNYEDYLIPEIHYFSNQVLSAVGDGILSIYKGSQIPELAKEITFEKKIKSVFYGEDQIGLVFDAEEGNLLQLYDLEGNVQAEITFDLAYEKIRITEHGVVIYNDTEVGIYGYNGKECFRHTFETAVLDIFPTGLRSKYLLIYNNETQMISLQ